MPRLKTDASFVTEWLREGSRVNGKDCTEWLEGVQADFARSGIPTEIVESDAPRWRKKRAFALRRTDRR